MKTGRAKKYQVRFKYYQYNDGRGNNGEYINKTDYTTLKEARKAKKFLDEYWSWNDHGYYDMPEKLKEKFNDDYDIDGYMLNAPYIVKITEEVLPDKK